MTFSTADFLVGSFERTHRIIKMQIDGLTHRDSVLQPPFRGNCLNWVLGHILAYRNAVLKHLGQPPVWSESEISRYSFGSDPITRDEQALPFEKLLDDLDQTQNAIVQALAQTSQEKLAALVQTGRGESALDERLAYLHWHETYHVGQLELLRQLAGKNDAVI